MKKALLVLLCVLFTFQTIAIVHYKTLAFRERQARIEANRAADSMLRLVEWSTENSWQFQSNYDALKQSWKAQKTMLDELYADSNFWVFWTNSFQK